MNNVNHRLRILLPEIKAVFVVLHLITAMILSGPQKTHAQMKGELNLVLRTGMAIQDLYVAIPIVNGKVAVNGWACQGNVPSSVSYPCTVKQSNLSTNAIRLGIDIHFEGGFTDGFTCDLALSSGKITGTYKGSYTGIPVSGNVSGSLVPFVSSYLPVKTSEHPCLLFRPSQVPYIRGKAATLQGQKMINNMKTMLLWDEKGFSWGYGAGRTAPQYCEGQWAAAHAFMYTLTGSLAELQRAKEVTTVAMMTRGGEMAGWGDASRWVGVALAYDMCYHGWDKEFRDQVYFFLKWYATYTRKGIDHMSAMFQSAGGISALAIRNDPVPLSGKPLAVSSISRTIKATRGFTYTSGITNAFTNGLMPKRWLWAGSFAPAGSEDPLAAIGGRAGARPEEGTSITYRGITTEFARTTDAMTTQKYSQQVRFDSPNPAFDLYKAGGCDVIYGKPCYRYYYTVIIMEKPRTVRCIFNDQGHIYGVSMWIAGEKVSQGEIVRLESGLYPVMVEMPLYGQLWAAPRLYEYDNAEYQKILTEWENIESDAQGFGGKSTFGSAISEMKAAHVINFALQRINANGSVSGGYDPWGEWGVMPSAADMLHCLLPFAQAYRNVTGKDICSGNNINMTIPYAMNGGTFYNDYGRDWWRVMGFYDVFPQNLKPQLKNAMDSKDNFGITLAWHGMFGLLNYPWDGKGGLPSAEEWSVTGTIKPTYSSIAETEQHVKPGRKRIYDLKGRVVHQLSPLPGECARVAGVYLKENSGENAAHKSFKLQFQTKK